ncbi:MAG: DUF5799 family protein [Natronomonas sp.]
MTDWQDLIVTERMEVDQQFSTQIDGSQFSRQEWGLIMTAVEFEIVDPADAEAAEITADTSNLPAILPELENISQAGPMGAGPDQESGGGGLLESALSALGIGGEDDDGVDEGKLAAAEELTAAYAAELQTHLENRGRWDEIRTAAADED